MLIILLAGKILEKKTTPDLKKFYPTGLSLGKKIFLVSRSHNVFREKRGAPPHLFFTPNKKKKRGKA